MPKSDKTIFPPYKAVALADLIPYARNSRTHVIVKRWQDFTGKQATLESDGRTFAEVAGERVPA